MSTYKELAICPICGARSVWTVNNSGDYDPPDKPHEENLNDCQTCKLLKQTNPGMYDLLATLWSKLLDERKAHKEQRDRLDRERYADFDLYMPFRDNPFIWKELAKVFRADIARHAKISRETGKKDPMKDGWVWEKSIETLVHKILEMIKKEKVRK